jgi:hypothetical protein
MAHACRMHKQTAWPALGSLIELGMVCKRSRSGQTGIFTVRPPGEWKLPDRKEDPTEKRTQVLKRGGTRPERGPDHPTEKRTHKVDPLEVDPINQIPLLPDKSSECERIYGLYPRKVGKKPALRAIAKAIKSHGFDTVLTATTRFAEAWKGEADLQFCPYPATWFGQERFADAPETWRTRPANQTPKPKPLPFKATF